ncbi:hypothetical protein HXX76_001420 [Chlamydomonas incerta]|uniref:Uncharacterized protein n=1 Tax=Chlamydomonas incerta TaxID=51695 RepID=A0A835WC80_CHLIN|nr:hypothetical protein HXX76_001420 [Chlamydomonas incerta]|eukprot:KAG2444676.1 hypothetical protein HXX76_001420 [Chlamydomonas incerta]
MASETCMAVAERPAWSALMECSVEQGASLILLAKHLAGVWMNFSPHQLVVRAAGLLQILGAGCPAWLRRAHLGLARSGLLGGIVFECASIMITTAAHWLMLLMFLIVSKLLLPFSWTARG